MKSTFIPGYTFKDMIRNPAAEEAVAIRRDMVTDQPIPRDQVFIGKLIMPDGSEACVARHGGSDGGRCGLYVLDFFVPHVPGSDGWINPSNLGEDGTSMTWMTEDQITTILQRVARLQIARHSASATYGLKIERAAIFASIMTMAMIAMVMALWVSTKTANTSMRDRPGTSASPTISSTASQR